MKRRKRFIGSIVGYLLEFSEREFPMRRILKT
jgi:hypothetical protein